MKFRNIFRKHHDDVVKSVNDMNESLAEVDRQL